MRRFGQSRVRNSIFVTMLVLSGLVFMAGPAQATVEIRAVEEANTGAAGATTLVITKPAGTVSGDFLVAHITVESGSDVVITPPSGFTSVIRTDNGNSIGQEIFSKVATGAEPANYTFNFSQSKRATGAVLAYTGVNTSNPIDASGGNTGNANPLTAPSVTTTSDNGKLLAFFGVKADTGIPTASGMSERYENRINPLPSSTANDQQLGAAGATGTRTTSPGTTGDWVATSVALRAIGNTCVKSGAVLDVTMLTGGNVTVTRSGVNFNVTGSDITDPTCGGATVNNIDTVNLVGSNLADNLTLDMSNGYFEPGLTAEGGTPEIEFTVDMNGGTDTFTVLGGTGDDSIYAGNSGLNLNASEATDDVDLTNVVGDLETLALTGGDGSDTLWGDGGEGSGTAYTEPMNVTGDNGRDFLAGSTKADTINGGAGVDVLKGGNGGDAMNGGTESDTTSYVGAGNITANLSTGTGSGGAAGGDTYTSISDIVSGGGDDTLTGDGNANLISGGAGNDTIKGGAEDDSLLGRAGSDDLEGEGGNDSLSPGAGTTTSDAIDGGAGTKDVADYGLAANAVTVDLAVIGNGNVDATGNQNTVGNGSDDVLNLEHIRGTPVGDTLRGDANDNFIFGFGGDDLIEGRAGLDKLSGGAGNDTLNGEAGDDIFHGGAGAADVCNGGADNDDFSQDEGTCETENQ